MKSRRMRMYSKPTRRAYRYHLRHLRAYLNDLLAQRAQTCLHN